MSVSDPIADMLTKIRNASRAGNEYTDLKISGITMEILKILKFEGYILNFKKVKEDSKQSRESLRVFLKYDSSKAPALKDVQRISKPGRRVYASYREIPRVLNGLGTIVVSTSNGIITDRLARKQQIGGELICSVW